jgi:TonB-dependent SusC/RagA subfamily outer membrane receptor
MKLFLRSLLLFLFIFNKAIAQKKLSSSREGSYFTYVYQLTDKEAFDIAAKSKSIIDDRFLHNQVDSFYTDKKQVIDRPLAYGNYLYVQTVRNQMNYTLKSVYNVNLEFINNRKDFQFAVSDLSGKPIRDAEVSIGNGKPVKFDPESQLYVTSKGQRLKVITVKYAGVNNYFTYELEGARSRGYRSNMPFFKRLLYSTPVRQIWMPFRKLFNPSRYGSPSRDRDNQYKGYMVFNKPRYKPLDTVKFKAYLVDKKGAALHNKTLDVVLSSYSGKDIVLTQLKPYREGGYAFDFVLVDSLKMRLDQDYYIYLKEKVKGKLNTVFSESFKYEEYELKSVNFAVRADKEIQSTGNPITFYLKATDENELAVPDGRVNVSVKTRSSYRYYDQKVFVKDSLWKTTVTMDPVGETKLVLPENIFPKADLDFVVEFEFLNSNNERRSDSKYLKYLYKAKELKSDFKQDSLHVDYLVDGKSSKTEAILFSNYPNREKRDCVRIHLPGSFKLNYQAINYEIKTADGFFKQIPIADLNAGIGINALQNKDSLRIVINNEHRVPFWYTVFSGNDVFLKGYGSRLDTLLKHNSSRAANIRINYLWAGEDKPVEGTAFYRPNVLKVSLLTPDLVYPGQEVKMQVKVTDVDNQPVPQTDVSAYAYTSKFKESEVPGLPDFGKAFYARKTKPGASVKELYTSGEFQLNWEKWGKALNLDTVEYYRFTQTKGVYTLQEDGDNPVDAVVAPFVVNNGDIQAVHALYIDGRPVYFSQAEQLQRYAFKVSPGMHTLKMRTGNRTVFLKDYTFPQGKKTIISVFGDVKNTRAQVREEKWELNDAEAVLLNNYMIRVTDNFQGQKAIIAAEKDTLLLKAPVLGDANSGWMTRRQSNSEDASRLIGPILTDAFTFRLDSLKISSEREPGYTYTFQKGLLRQKSFSGKYGFSTSLNQEPTLGRAYKQYPIRKGEIDSIWNDYLNLRSSTTSLFYNRGSSGKDYGQLVMSLDSNIRKQLPYLKNVIIYRYDDPSFLQVYPGNGTSFNSLQMGGYRVIYLFKDNRYVVAENMNIQSNGLNYFEWKGLKIHPADALSLQIDNQIKQVNIGGQLSEYEAKLKILENINDVYLDPSSFTNEVFGRVLARADKSPVAGAIVKIKGSRNWVITNASGNFSIKVPAKGTLLIQSIGYDTREISVGKRDAGDIFLSESNNELSEVVVTSYGAKQRRSVVAAESAVPVSALIEGRVAGLTMQNASAKMIRGVASLTNENKPLIFVDGLPFTGSLDSLDPATIASMNVMKGAEATAIYGARASGGVILVKTKAGSAATTVSGALVQQQGTMRTNFSDYAIWQPKLLTDAEGKASFTVKFPDDITNWDAKVIAMNGRKQSGAAQMNIKSFKVLSANFVSPQFALAGDSIHVIGKLMNYSNIEEEVTRKFSYNGTELLNNPLKYKNAKIDTIAIVAKGAGLTVRDAAVGVQDSLTFEYSMRQQNGYFDGELRKIPLFQTGVQETKGYFDVLARDTTVTYHFDPKLGKVTLNAEASVFPALLQEIEKVDRYEYLCNEQLASKLKVLLQEKKIRKYLGDPFTKEKNIANVLKRLLNNRSPLGTWGWWQNSNEELWISLHVVESLLEAQKQGYAVDLDKERLYSYLVSKMTVNKNFDQVYGIKLIRLLNEGYDLKSWVNSIEQERLDLEAKYAMARKKNPELPELAKQSLYERLQLVQLKQFAGIPVDLKWILDAKKETMFGNLYWGDQSNRFWDNSIQNTLLAYQILKSNGNYKMQLDRIQRYFLEQRKDGQWRNTYESSLILETILPDLMVGGKKPEPAALVLNQSETIAKFPFHKEMAAGELKVKQQGNAPVYFTAYQQFQNTNPEKVSKDFTVKTSFLQAGLPVSKLKAGTLVTLTAEVEVRADADYVMIEIPIPAGCSYENKMQRFWGLETHREYFKNKTSIFCTKLKKGKYSFSIDLMPRYSGNYVLNPAKAEMMYFPVFYGREGMKRIAVK